MKIAMLVAVLGERDAVGTDVREMAARLTRLGHEVRLFATVTHSGGDARRSRSRRSRHSIADPQAILIYHFAFGWAPGVELLRRARCRRVVRYHNVTPPEFFAGWSTEYEAACRAGRDEIAALAALGCELYLGASPFNVEDFLAAGVRAERTAVLAPFNRTRPPDRHARPTSPCSMRLRDGAAQLARGRTPRAEQGPPRPARRVRGVPRPLRGRRAADPGRQRGCAPGELQRGDPRAHRVIAARLRMCVSCTASTTARSRRRTSCADALVSLSGHEGFCVPLAEAMALGVPVVALAHGAQAVDLDGAGLVWDEAEPALIAAAVERLHQDAVLRSELRERGYARVASAFTPSVLTAPTRRDHGHPAVKRVAIVVQRCHESVVGGSEALAWQYARLLASAFDVEVLTSTATEHVNWNNALPAERVRRDGIVVRRFPVAFMRQPYWAELYRRLDAEAASPRSAHWREALQDEFIRFQGPCLSRPRNVAARARRAVRRRRCSAPICIRPPTSAFARWRRTRRS